MEYNERTYRGEHFDSPQRRSFSVCHKKTDLWISVDRSSYCDDMERYCIQAAAEMWHMMESYLATDTSYITSLTPYHPSEQAPNMLKRMSGVADITGIGPMSAVAGACSEYIANKLKEKFGYKEIIIENGGDIYAELLTDTDIAVFAGESPLSGKVGFSIPAKMSPIGICTSSGTVGPSLSFGKADAVMIICRDVLLADSYATAFANKIKTTEDIEPTMALIEKEPHIIAAIAIKDNKLGLYGSLPLRIFSSDL